MENYFDLYNLPVSFRPDAAVVKSKYYELSRQYHPDRFTLSSDSEQADALHKSSLNNQAFKVLKDEYATIAYILKLKGVLEDEEKYNLPPDFLMEMMELNEALSDFEDQPDNKEMLVNSKTMLDSLLNDWQQETTPLTTEYDNGTHTEELLLKIKEQYFRKKYLLRIRERIEQNT